jgi:large subunit ribosomal protein L25
VTEFVINAEERRIVGKKVKQLRNEGIVPVTVYGPNTDPINLQVPYRPLEVALMKAGGTNIIDINYGSKTIKVLARDVQRNPLKGFILHADFFAIDADSKIVTAVPIQFVGESPAVETGKGILMVGTNSINVETLPSNLINAVEVDLGSLEKVGDAITVADLNLGDDVTILSDPEETIARIAQSAAARRQEMLDSGINPDGDDSTTTEQNEE